jgi:hypothetical protein
MEKEHDCIRIPFLLKRENPKHQLVFHILEKADNRSEYIREAVIFYHRHNGAVVKEDSILEDIRILLQENNQQLLLEIDKRWEDKNSIDYDKLKNMF